MKYSYHEVLNPFPAEDKGFIPSAEECFKIWDKYEMPQNIKEHSLMVGEVAAFIARLGKSRGFNVNVDLIKAGALLHDLGKFYSLKYGGSHSQIGAAWAMEETKNPAIAQCIIHHVFWPAEIDLKKFFAPLVVLYADKRVRHSKIVSLDERYEDILQRYGSTPKRKELIMMSYNKVKKIEKRIFKELGVDLNANSIDRWRMVS